MTPLTPAWGNQSPVIQEVKRNAACLHACVLAPLIHMSAHVGQARGSSTWVKHVGGALRPETLTECRQGSLLSRPLPSCGIRVAFACTVYATSFHGQEREVQEEGHE